MVERTAGSNPALGANTGSSEPTDRSVKNRVCCQVLELGQIGLFSWEPVTTQLPRSSRRPLNTQESHDAIGLDLEAEISRHSRIGRNVRRGTEFSSLAWFSDEVSDESVIRHRSIPDERLAVGDTS